MKNWFDEVAKATGEGLSRRESVRRLGAGLLGALGLGLATRRSEAALPASADVPCVSDITLSPYYKGCQDLCGGKFNPTTNADNYTACVVNCVDCADPYYCEGTVDPKEPYGLVCTDNNNNFTCCGKTGTVYRTCRNAAKDKYRGCVAFQYPA